MRTTRDELRRVRVRIGDLERSLNDLWEGQGESSHALDKGDRQRILCLLTNTLDAMRARRTVLERLRRSD
jgi:hypothetical protein